MLELVHEVQTTPPYCYGPDEAAPVGQWFPALIDRADQAFLAYRPETAPVGYCVALPLADHHEAAQIAELLGVDLDQTRYLAELAVAAPGRRQEIASALLDRVLDPPETTDWVVRTVAGNQPARDLYRKYGFTLVHGVAQRHHGREKVFLRRARP